MRLNSSSCIMLAMACIVVALILVAVARNIGDDYLTDISEDKFPVQLRKSLQDKTPEQAFSYLDSLQRIEALNRNQAHIKYISKLKIAYDSSLGHEERLKLITSLAEDEYKATREQQATREGIQRLQHSRTKLYIALFFSLALLGLALIRLRGSNIKQKKDMSALEKRADDLNQQIDKIVSKVHLETTELKVQLTKKSMMLTEYESTIEKLRRTIQQDRMKYINPNTLIDKLSKIVLHNYTIPIIEEIPEQLKGIESTLYKQLTTQYPSLTANNLKLCIYLWMNLSTKEIATIMHTSVAGIKMARSRLREKFGIKGSNISLSAFLNTLEQEIGATHSQIKKLKDSPNLQKVS